ncbi:MAG TPA: hypothetical protein ENK84_05850 [Desulfobulbus sp.]|nr:hypothetical protein [Desulfobulbus sp.]
MEKMHIFCILCLSLAACLLIGRPYEAMAAGFEQNLTSGGITFHVVSVKEGEASRVKITLSGPGVDSRSVESRVAGAVTWAEITDDLDNDGSPELYIYASCPDDVAAGSNHNLYSAPPAAAVVTTGPQAGHHGSAAVVVAPGAGSPSAVVVGPAVTARTAGGTVGMVPVVPVEPPGESQNQPCIHELKFILVPVAKGKTLKLQYSR